MHIAIFTANAGPVPNNLSQRCCKYQSHKYKYKYSP